MKTYYALPSGTYNIALSAKDIAELVTTGRLVIFMGDKPCKTGRALYDDQNDTMITLDEKEVTNDLRFYLDDDVADIKSGDWNVQFLSIHLEDDHEENC